LGVRDPGPQTGLSLQEVRQNSGFARVSAAGYGLNSVSSPATKMMRYCMQLMAEEKTLKTLRTASAAGSLPKDLDS
jgi:hypothetical protein